MQWCVVVVCGRGGRGMQVEVYKWWMKYSDKLKCGGGEGAVVWILSVCFFFTVLERCALFRCMRRWRRRRRRRRKISKGERSQRKERRENMRWRRCVLYNLEVFFFW